MDENIIAANLAAKIETNTHVPAPVIEEGPQPSAFETNIELNDPAIGLQLTDYFDIGRIDRFNEVTQRQLRSVYQWAAERAGSAELANVLGVIRSVELELGATDATGTDRYFYVDDMNVAYPAGVAIDLGNLDLWAEGLPVAPAIATMPSLGGVWDEPLSAHTIAGSAGKILKDGADDADTAANK